MALRGRSFAWIWLVGSLASLAQAQGGFVAEARGEAGYRIPIVVPAGPAGHQPELALVYASGEGRGAAGWLGFGWSLGGESRIERESRTGSPYDYDDASCGASGLHPCYRRSYALDGQDLVCSSGTCSVCTTGAPCRYRTQADDGRLIEFLGDSAGWKIRDRDGRTLVYGAASDGSTRLSNPANLIGQVYSWQLERSTDVSGNAIRYLYDTTSSANVAYLARIEYGQGAQANRSVAFILNDPATAPRPDRPISARAGFRQQVDRRVTAIVVRAAADALVTRYELSYVQDPDSTRSQLASVRRVGGDGLASVPPYRFDYSFRAAVRGFTGSFEGSFNAPPSCHPGGGNYGDSSVGGVVETIADMNRDGLGDLYQVKNPSGTAPGGVLAALGTGRMLRAGPGEACTSSSGPALGTLWSTHKLLFSHGLGGSAALDFDGDGYLDHLFVTGHPHYELSTRLRLGSAAGFLEPPLVTSFDFAGEDYFATESYVFDRPYIRIAETSANAHVDVLAAMTDVTADGRPDLVISSFDGPLAFPGPVGWPGWAVFVNRGLAADAGVEYLDFGADPTRWVAPPNAPIQHDSLGFESTVVLADQNGDGLADRVAANQVEYGYGAGFLTPESVASPTGPPVVNSTCNVAGVYDLNGDGFLDHVNASGAGNPIPIWRVHFGTGHGFSPQQKQFPADGQGVNPGCIEADGQTAASAALRDMNGDGVPDRLNSGFGVMLNAGALDPNAAGDPNLPSAVRPGLLLRATDPLGGVVEFSYQTAPQMRDASGLPANPGFSVPLPVVTRVTLRDGRAGTPAISTLYAYRNGAFDYAEKEFRGFGTVIATQLESGAVTAVTTASYRTDRGCAFARVAVETAQGASALARQSTEHQIVSGGGEAPDSWAVCLPVSHLDTAVEGDEAASRTRRTAFHYGAPVDPNHNLVRLEEWGEWDPIAQQDVPGDERITEYAYATPSSAFPSIVSRVKLETVKDAAGKVHAKRQTCYFAAGCVAAGSGRPVVVRAFLTDTSVNPPLVDVAKTVATILYDAYGNPAQHTGAATAADPDGLRTTIAYDATYRTFPTSVSVGSDVSLPLRALVTQVAYQDCAAGLAPPPGLGLPCGVSAPGVALESFGYDALGRVIRRERPASGYVETRSYALAGAADPGHNVFETRVLRPGAADLVERRFSDGLARPFREESPGRETETVVVERSFDGRGHLQSESLPYSSGAPLVRTFSYDAIGRPKHALDADGATLRAHSYAPWTLIEETYLGAYSPGQRAERSERSVDGLGRLVRVAQFEDAVAANAPFVVTARYDAADRLLEVRDPVANDVSLCAQLSTVGPCATQDHVTEIAWDTLGRRVRVDDPDSGVWTWRYDDVGRELVRTQNGGTSSARTRLTSYDALGRRTSRSFSPAGNGVASASFWYESDPASPAFAQLLEVRSTGPSATSYLYGYDAAGRRDSVIQRTAGLEFGSAWELDALGRVTRRLFPDGDAFDYGYDGLRLREIRADSGNAAFTGAVLAHAEYDALGRMTQIAIGERASGSPIATQTYGYDSANARLSRITGAAGGTSADDPDGDRVGVNGDSCPHAWNPAQSDGGGVGDASAPDGIGDACQCGDVDASGRVTVGDALAILTLGMGWPLAAPGLCDVDGDESCDPTDFFVVMAALSSGSADLQHCPASLAANTPSSAPLDLNLDFDGLGRLTAQTGSLGDEPLSRSFAYDGLSRLVSAVGPWEQARGESGAVTWTWTYDALGNLRSQTSSRPSWYGDHRAWHYYEPSKPRFLSQFARDGALWETISATAGGEPAMISTGNGHSTRSLTWNALGRLHRFGDATHHYDVFGDARLVVLGPPGASASIVRAGDDFEYDRSAQRANKSFSVAGVRIATLATSYAAPSAATPPIARFAARHATRLAEPIALALLATAFAGLASVAARRPTPRWLAASGIGVLSSAVATLPHFALAATLGSGPGKHGRHAEPILAYLSDQLGSTRAVVNQDGAVIETRDYAPFGESIAHTGAFAVQHRFTGQPQNESAGGLYNYGARFYNPTWGRFMSPDQVTQGFDSQGLNPYTYVLNAPTNHVDPTGEMIINGWSFGAWSTSTLSNQGVLGRGPGDGREASLAEVMRPGVAGNNGMLREGVLVGDDARMAAELEAVLAKSETPGSSSIAERPSLADRVGDAIRGEILDVTGMMIGTPTGIISGIGEIVGGTLTLNPRLVLEGLKALASTAMPRLGSHGGLGHPVRYIQLPESGTKPNNASIWHDDFTGEHGFWNSAAQFGWTSRAWAGEGVEPGPYGQAYRLLGTVLFGTGGVIQWATGY